MIITLLSSFHLSERCVWFLGLELFIFLFGFPNLFLITFVVYILDFYMVSAAVVILIVKADSTISRLIRPYPLTPNTVWGGGGGVL